MTIKIGHNIRRLRSEKGMTQEQLAKLLNVSAAAVSKWESGQSLPDITMIMPLAKVFEITTDELMGYDAALAEAEVDALLTEHQHLARTGYYEQAAELIAKAREEHPADYRIMNRYMWELVGGSADNDPALLLKHEQELTAICDCIEEGCRDPHLQFEAITMRAKLLHAAGETDKAVALLQRLSSPYQTADHKTEQLFAKNTPEFRYWNRRNMIGYTDFLSTKLFRSIWFDNTRTLEERIDKIEALGELFGKMYERSGEIVFPIVEHMMYAMLWTQLTLMCDDMNAVLRLTEKLLLACAKITDAAKTDEVLSEAMKRSYGTDDLVAWTVNERKTSQHPSRARPRENAAYMALLERFEK